MSGAKSDRWSWLRMCTKPIYESVSHQGTALGTRAPRQSAEAGFTLLELLVAITVTGLILLGAYSLLQATSEAWRRAEATVDQTRAERATFDFMARVIRSVYRPLGGASGGIMVGQAGQETSDIRADELQLVTASFPFPGDEPPASDIWRVHFLIAPANPTGMAEDVTALADGDGPPALWIRLEDQSARLVSQWVRGLGLRYLSGGEWVNEWPESMRSLPQAVEITLWLGSDGDAPETWTARRRLIALPAAGE